jgi:hypothetical protein
MPRHRRRVDQTQPQIVYATPIRLATCQLAAESAQANSEIRRRHPDPDRLFRLAIERPVRPLARAAPDELR